MLTEEKLLADVLANPDDDEPRLAYASYYEKRGDIRGEFIRLQIRAMQMRRESNYSNLLSLGPTTRAREILKIHGDEWLRPFFYLVNEPRFYRGFLEGVTFTVTKFLAFAPELYKFAPIRHVDFEKITAAEMTRLARSPLLTPLVSLWLNKGDEIGDEEVEILARSPYLGNLRWLDLSFNRITVRGVEALCASTSMPQLAFLNLAGNPVPEPGESCGVDGMSGLIVWESIALSDFGRRLEARFGYRAWLHNYSELPMFEGHPLEGDL